MMSYKMVVWGVFLICAVFVHGASAFISITGPGTGEVYEKSEHEYTVYSPKNEHTVKFEESSDEPVTFHFIGWSCGLGADRLYMHARAVVKGAPSWPKESLDKIMNAIAEGKVSDKRKKRSYKELKSGTTTINLGLRSKNRAEMFLKSQGTSFSIKDNPTLIVPAPGKREINSCYTHEEIDQILNAVEQAVRNALNKAAAS